MNIKAKELVDLISSKNHDGIQDFIKELRQRIKQRLSEEEKDLYELSVMLKINYNILSNYIHGNVDFHIAFDSLFKLVKYLNN